MSDFTHGSPLAFILMFISLGGYHESSKGCESIDGCTTVGVKSPGLLAQLPALSKGAEEQGVSRTPFGISCL